MAPKVVAITGCSTGIGLETAVFLASDKEKRFKVFATMRNLKKKGDLEKAAGATLNKTLFIWELDVTKEASKNAFMERINKEEGGVDILINNAGVGHSNIIDLVTDEELKEVFDTNVFGLIRLTQAVIPGMKAKKSGRIINISSMAGVAGLPFYDIYCSSKFAVEGFSEALAPYLKEFNVWVTLIEPGPVVTKFGENMENAGGMGLTGVSDNIDKETQELRKKQLSMGWSERQQSRDIAEIIQKAILSEKPHLRYQTSEALVKQACIKFQDPTGDSMVQAVTQMSGWDK
ncbi:retinol dehydrogenase 8-like [Amphiura filiformis]|uniref:retinol dehydrogenase 8-like n=1 Tax=Amphiura filiformis TaxID=82378 RepID=UPI003B21B298